MIANLIGGFVTILIGTSLIGPISTQVNNTATQCGGITSGGITYSTALGSTLCSNGTSTTNTSANPLFLSSTWAPTVLQLVPGFFALALFGVALFVMYNVLQKEGILSQ